MPRFRATVALAYDLDIDGVSTGDAADRAMAVIMARPGMRADHVSSIQVQPILADAPEVCRESNLAYWQEAEAIRHGTARQHQLWDQAALPDHELTDIAREILFAPFRPFRRRVRMGSMAVHAGHVTSMSTAPCTTAISWTSIPCELSSLARWELATLNRIIETSQKASEHPWLRPAVHNFSVEVRQHVGVCQSCDCSASDASALVSVQWAGRTLSREYAL
jgi:hypothetical protein